MQIGLVANEKNYILHFSAQKLGVQRYLLRQHVHFCGL